MKFLSEEWFDAMCSTAKELFDKPGRLNMTYCEVYENCPGENETVWTWFEMVNSQLGEAKMGYGEDDIPEATYRCFGDYDNYVKVCKGELDPNKGIISGAFTLEGNLMKAMTMLGTYAKVTQAKKQPDLEF